MSVTHHTGVFYLRLSLVVEDDVSSNNIMVMMKLSSLSPTTLVPPLHVGKEANARSTHFAAGITGVLSAIRYDASSSLKTFGAVFCTFGGFTIFYDVFAFIHGVVP